MNGIEGRDGTGGTDDSAPQYWYCLKHRTVEGEEGCANAHRLGPYPTAAEAEQALERVEERNEAWDNDPAWNDDLDDEED